MSVFRRDKQATGCVWNGQRGKGLRRSACSKCVRGWAFPRGRWLSTFLQRYNKTYCLCYCVGRHSPPVCTHPSNCPSQLQLLYFETNSSLYIKDTWIGQFVTPFISGSCLHILKKQKEANSHQNDTANWHNLEIMRNSGGREIEQEGGQEADICTRVTVFLCCLPCGVHFAKLSTPGTPTLMKKEQSPPFCRWENGQVHCITG